MTVAVNEGGGVFFSFQNPERKLPKGIIQLDATPTDKTESTNPTDKVGATVFTVNEADILIISQPTVEETFEQDSIGEVIVVLEPIRCRSKISMKAATIILLAPVESTANKIHFSCTKRLITFVDIPFSRKLEKVLRRREISEVHRQSLIGRLKKVEGETPNLKAVFNALMECWYLSLEDQEKDTYKDAFEFFEIGDDFMALPIEDTIHQHFLLDKTLVPDVYNDEERNHRFHEFFINVDKNCKVSDKWLEAVDLIPKNFMKKVYYDPPEFLSYKQLAEMHRYLTGAASMDSTANIEQIQKTS